MVETISATQLVIEGFFAQWRYFKEKLPQELHSDFDKLMKHAKKHPIPGPEPIPFQPIAISILLEQQKEIKRLREKLNPKLKQECPRCNAELNREEFKGSLCPDCKDYLFFTYPNKKITNQEKLIK